MHVRLLALAILVLWPASARAEWQIKPFLGVTFGGGTTFVDFEGAVGERNLVYGVSGLLLGEVLGVEVDFGHAPGFFESGDQGQIVESSVTTWTGNVVVALPRRVAEYSLRPYFVAGLGMMRLRIDDKPFDFFGNLTDVAMAVDVGGGVTGFLSNDIGVSWDVRHFRRVDPNGEERGLSVCVEGVSVCREELSFWRANMAIAFRF